MTIVIGIKLWKDFVIIADTLVTFRPGGASKYYLKITPLCIENEYKQIALGFCSNDIDVTKRTLQHIKNKLGASNPPDLESFSEYLKDCILDKENSFPARDKGQSSFLLGGLMNKPEYEFCAYLLNNGTVSTVTFPLESDIETSEYVYRKITGGYFVAIGSGKELQQRIYEQAEKVGQLTGINPNLDGAVLLGAMLRKIFDIKTKLSKEANVGGPITLLNLRNKELLMDFIFPSPHGDDFSTINLKKWNKLIVSDTDSANIKYKIRPLLDMGCKKA